MEISSADQTKLVNFFFVRVVGFEYGNVFFLFIPKIESESEREEDDKNHKKEKKKKNMNRMARKCSLTMTPSQNIMCIVFFG